MTDTLTNHPSRSRDALFNHSHRTSADQTLLNILNRGGLMELGEAYIRGEWTAPHLDQVLYDFFTTPQKRFSPRVWWKLAKSGLAHKFLNNQVGRRAFEVGEQHYDLGNDLFSVMLDPSMTYTCGYWKNAFTLAEAQQAKLERLCQKLDLRPGQTVLDIGCGWGNFARYAAENHGVRVVGVTVSKEQAAEARSRCAGLPVEIRLQDYREVTEQFDRVVSIEMIEAVGRKNISTYYRTVDRCLKPGGIFALQSIHANTWSRTSDRRMDQYLLWILKYIFPNGYLPNQSELANAGGTALRINEWECFGSYYDQTLLAWAENFARGWDQIKNQYSEQFRRRWEFYLFGCAALFRAKHLQVGHIIYSKGSV